MTLAGQLASLEAAVNAIPDEKPSTDTAFEVLDITRLERAWQAYLAYFLDPARNHSLGATYLREFVKNLQGMDRVDPNSLPPTQHLYGDVVVKTESASKSGNIPDIVLYNESRWYLCLELKIDSGEETGDQPQTERYAEDKEIVPQSTDEYDHGAYLYLSPETSPPSKSDQFVDVDWTELLPLFESVLSNRMDGLPLATVAQLNDFRQTIEEELTMTDPDHTTTERKNLYFEHREAIDNVNVAVIEFVEQTLQRDWKTGVEQNLEGTEAGELEWQYGAVGESYGQLRLPSWVEARDAPPYLDVHLEHKPKEDHFKNGRLELLLEIEEPDKGTFGPTSDPQYSAFRNDMLGELDAVVDDIRDKPETYIKLDPSNKKKRLLKAEYGYQAGDEQGYYASLATGLNDLFPVAELVTNTLASNDYTNLIEN